MRIIVYVDKQANGATAAITDILKTASLSSYRNLDQVDRFIILDDQVVALEQQVVNSASSVTGDCAKQWKVSKKCNIPIHFNAAAGAITELRSNNVGVAFITTTTQANFAFQGTARVKFTDD